MSNELHNSHEPRNPDVNPFSKWFYRPVLGGIAVFLAVGMFTTREDAAPPTEAVCTGKQTVHVEPGDNLTDLFKDNVKSDAGVDTTGATRAITHYAETDDNPYKGKVTIEVKNGDYYQGYDGNNLQAGKDLNLPKECKAVE